MIAIQILVEASTCIYLGYIFVSQATYLAYLSKSLSLAGKHTVWKQIISKHFRWVPL